MEFSAGEGTKVKVAVSPGYASLSRKRVCTTLKVPEASSSELTLRLRPVWVTFRLAFSGSTVHSTRSASLLASVICSTSPPQRVSALRTRPPKGTIAEILSSVPSSPIPAGSSFGPHSLELRRFPKVPPESEVSGLYPSRLLAVLSKRPPPPPPPGPKQREGALVTSPPPPPSRFISGEPIRVSTARRIGLQSLLATRALPPRKPAPVASRDAPPSKVIRSPAFEEDDLAVQRVVIMLDGE